LTANAPTADAALAGRLRLIVVTDASLARDRGVVRTVGAALVAGAPAIQLREKSLGARDQLQLARALRERTTAAGALLFVNDRLDVALAAGADGAHLGDDDVPLAAARRITPAGFLLGASAATPGEALRARADGADYLGVGAVYGTTTKRDAGGAIGVARLAEVVAAVGAMPVVGIGGIDADNAVEVVRSGAAGVAVVGAVMAAADPDRAVYRLLRAVAAGRADATG
jgi:thiamine-phosphate pyrophosphorylase